MSKISVHKFKPNEKSVLLKDVDIHHFDIGNLLGRPNHQKSGWCCFHQHHWDFNDFTHRMSVNRGKSCIGKYRCGRFHKRHIAEEKGCDEMKYIKWFLLAIIDILFNAVCYITNPIILLFADELGNLPAIFKWWENWDDHIDVDWMVTEHHVPKWAEYDFNRHYQYIDEWQAEKTIGVHRGYVILLDPCFTAKERIQRYICRLVWLYRNCGYGFSYWVTGIDVNEKDIIKKVDEYGHIFYVTDDAFCYKDERTSFGHYHWDNYVGWKFRHCKGTQRCMLACRINPFMK